MSDPVRKIGVWLPVSEDDLVDAGYEVPGYEERQTQAKAASDRYWRSLSWQVRLTRRLTYLRWRQRDRMLNWLHERLFPDHDL